MSTSEVTDGYHLAGFLEAFSKMEGKALAGQVATVLSHPQIFVFGELLALASVKKLADSPDTKPVHEQLEMFAYGTFAQYQANPNLPKLSERQARKLKQLTIVSLASENRSLSYEQLTETLNITSVRELEDLIIESVYIGLVSGKLNQAKKVFEVAEVCGRDVRAEDVAEMLTMLTTWSKTSGSVMYSIHERIQAAEEEHARAASAKSKRERDVEEKFATVRAILESDADGRKGAGFAGVDEQFLSSVLNSGSRKKGFRPRNG